MLIFYFSFHFFLSSVFPSNEENGDGKERKRKGGQKDNDKRTYNTNSQFNGKRNWGPEGDAQLLRVEGTSQYISHWTLCALWLHFSADSLLRPQIQMGKQIQQLIKERPRQIWATSTTSLLFTLSGLLSLNIILMKGTDRLQITGIQRRLMFQTIKGKHSLFDYSITKEKNTLNSQSSQCGQIPRATHYVQ